MKFYKIQTDKKEGIINLETIRTAQVLDNEIYLTFTCGDIQIKKIVFGSPDAAAEAFDDLCDALDLKETMKKQYVEKKPLWDIVQKEFELARDRADLKAMNYCNFFLQQLSVAEVKEIEE